MGFFDSAWREISKGVGAVGGFLGDIGSSALESFSDVGPTAQTGAARRIGGFLGDIGEQVVGGFLAPAAPTMPLPPTVPGGIGGIRPDRIPIAQPLPGYREVIGDQPLQRGMIAPDVSAGQGMSLSPPMEVTQMAFPVALPGGAAIAGAISRQLPGILGGLAGGELIEQAAGAVQAAGQIALPHAGMMYRRTPAGVRARRTIVQIHPTSGDLVAWRYVGRAKRFQGDERIMRSTAKEMGLCLRRRGGR